MAFSWVDPSCLNSSKFPLWNKSCLAVAYKMRKCVIVGIQNCVSLFFLTIDTVDYDSWLYLAETEPNIPDMISIPGEVRSIYPGQQLIKLPLGSRGSHHSRCWSCGQIKAKSLSGSATEPCLPEPSRKIFNLKGSALHAPSKGQACWLPPGALVSLYLILVWQAHVICKADASSSLLHSFT